MREIELRDKMENAYMTYSMATIIDRALPDVRDGLFPIHRRILYAMKNAKITHNKDVAKSTQPVSETMKIHHHGDSSIYGSLALLTEENESMLYPYINGNGGSFGKVYSNSSPAHARYTFCKLNEFTEEMFMDFDKDVVKMVGGDEEEHPQPTTLNPSFPSILVKPNNGIAVGKSCSFGSFPLNEVCELTKAYIENKDIDVVDYLTPDFSTGAYLLYNKEELKKIYETGKGSVTLRSKYRFDEKDNIIEVYEIPYKKTGQKICSEITDKMKDFKDILDVRYESGFNKKIGKEELLIAIEVRKNTNIDGLMEKLFKCTSLQANFSYNMNCLVNYTPKLLGVKEILDNWLEFKESVINKALKHTLQTKSDELEILNGLEKVLLDVDKAVEIVRFSEDGSIISNLCNHFNITEVQAEHINNLRLRKINKNYIIEQLKDIESLREEVSFIATQIDNKEEIVKIIVDDLDRVSKKYSKPRKTEILHAEKVLKNAISEDDMIEDFNHYISISKQGYLYKYLRATNTFKLKDDDEIISTTSTSNKATVLVFTNLGNCHKIFSHTIETKLPSQLGHYIPNLINLQDGEDIISVQVIRKYEGFLINVYEDNRLAKVNLSAFKTEQKRMLLKNSISLESPLIKQFVITEDIDILVQSSIDKVLICNTADFNAKNTKSVNGDGLIKSKNGSMIKFVERLDKLDLNGIISVDYYRGKRNAVGTFLKKDDKIIK